MYSNFTLNMLVNLKKPCNDDLIDKCCTKSTLEIVINQLIYMLMFALQWTRNLSLHCCRKHYCECRILIMLRLQHIHYISSNVIENHFVQWISFNVIRYGHKIRFRLRNLTLVYISISLDQLFLKRITRQSIQ